MARTLPRPEATSPLAIDLAVLGLLVRNHRREQSMRIDDAAALLGVSTGVLSRLENGTPVGTDRLMRVLDGLGLSLFVVTRQDATRVLRTLEPETGSTDERSA